MYLTTDHLTEGYNRKGFLTAGQAILDKNKELPYAVVCLNICNFYRINELWGEDTGNDVLRFIYQTLTQCIDEKELVYRDSMDQFVLLLHEQTEEKISERTASIIEQVNCMIQKKFQGYHMNFSIGACQLFHENQIASAVNNGIYVCKQKHKTNTCAFYNSDISQKIKDERRLNEAFSESLKNHDFKIYLQPKVSRDGTCQAEALVRWMHPEQGMIPPDMFISLFERNGKIHELDLYVFEEVCRMIAERKKEGREQLEISVNISRFTLRETGTEIWKTYKKIKEKYQIPDGVLEIELTETTLLDIRQITYIQHVLNGFRSCGLKVALDDFGFAYSSLALLKSFDVDTIKLDRSFFIDENEKSRKIVANIINLAHSLNMLTVAEGIEDPEQAEILWKSGCDFIQGYVYSRPLPSDAFEEWRKKNEKTAD